MNGRIPILEEIIKYNKEDNLILSMPGNKCGKGFTKDYIGREFLEKMGYLDITEVEPLDNLHHPQGIIKESIELLKNYYESDKAYFLVNGSTSGNLISIFSAFEEGDHILVERNCHKSIYNALILKKLKVSYIKGKVDVEKDIFLPPTKKDIEEALNENKNIKGVILTYPNYFGVCYDIKDLILDLKNKKIKTIIDSAHGAHFKCGEDLPESLTSVADYIILSAHKTIPSLTQGAYLIVNEKNSRVDFYFNALTSTSPSYLLLASLDYGRHYMEEYGNEDYKELINRCEKWKSKIEQLNEIHIYDTEDLEEGYLIDKTRYTIFLKKEYSGELLLEYLRKEKIQCEMSFSRGVVLLFSTLHGDEEFEKLYKALKKLDLEDIKQKVSLKSRFIQKIPDKRYEPFEMLDKEYIEIEINKKLVSKIAKEHIVPYPPGIPLLCPGEEITEEIIEIILAYLDEKRDIIGINNRKIKIIDK